MSDGVELWWVPRPGWNAGVVVARRGPERARRN